MVDSREDVAWNVARGTIVGTTVLDSAALGRGLENLQQVAGVVQGSEDALPSKAQAASDTAVYSLPSGPPSPHGGSDQYLPSNDSSSTGGSSSSGKGGGPKAVPKEKPKTVPYWKLFVFADPLDGLFMVLGTIGALALGASFPLMSVLFGRLINSFGNNMDDLSQLKDAVNQTALLYIYLACGAAAGAYLESLWAVTGTRQAARIRRLYLRAILRQDIGFFDVETTAGEVVGRMSGDTLLIQDAMSEKVGLFLRLMTQFVAGFIVAFARGWKLTLVMVATTPLMAFAGFVMMVVMTKMAGKGQEAYAEAGSLAEQVIGSIRTVASFVGERKSAKEYGKSLQAAYRTGVLSRLASGAGMGLFMLTMFCSYALALWYGSRLIAADSYTGGTVMNVIFACLIAGMSIGQAAPSLTAFATGMAAAYKMFEVINRVPSIDVEDMSGMTLEHTKGDIELRYVTFTYPARPDMAVFRNFSLKADAGRTLALVGESGSGKSTVVSLLERFYDPQEGAVMLDGIDIRKLQLKWLRKQMALVSQEPALFATTIRANIAYGKEGATDQEIETAARAANAHKFITKLLQAYDTQVGERGTQLSGGQKQRVAIARAVLKDPRILLLDEATSALDTESERKVQAALDHVMVGRTTIVIAHRLSTVMGADKIAVVQRGQVVEEGVHHDLMANPTSAYSALVKLQEMAQKETGLEDNAPPLTDTAQEDEDLAAAVKVTGPGEKPTISESSDAAGQGGGFLKTLKLNLSGLTARKVPSSDVRPDAIEKHVAGDVVEEGAGRKAQEVAQAPSWLRRRTKDVEKGEEEVVDLEEKPKEVPFSRLAKLGSPETGIFILGCIAAGIRGATFPVFSYLLSAIITTFYEPVDEMKSDADFWALMFVVLAVTTGLASFFSQWLLGIMGERITRRVRRLAFAAVLRQEIAWFDKDINSAGRIGARLSGDAASIQAILGDQFVLLVQNMVTLIVGLAIAFSACWQLTLVVLCIAPLLVIGGMLQMLSMRGAQEKSKVLYESASQVANDATGNIRTVAAYGAQERISALYREQVTIPEREGERRGQLTGLGLGYSFFMTFAAYSLAFWYGGKLVASGATTFESVLRVFFAITMSAMGVSHASTMAPDMAKAKVGVASIFHILDRVPKIDAEVKGVTDPPVKGEITFKGVDFTYPSRPDQQIFKSMTFYVSAGQTAALVGESGSGKSTCITLIERFYDPDAGCVLVDGVDIRQLQLHWLRRQVGLVSQEPNLFNTSIRDNIMYGKETATEDEVEAAARAANAWNFIQDLPDKLNTVVGERGVQLSGGQKQRVAIARAVLKDPRILLLDEATSALDAESERLVQDALDKIMVGRTTIVIAHRLTTVKHASKIMVVHGGKIAEEGTHMELLAIPGGAYANLVKLHGASTSKKQQPINVG